MCTLLMFGRMDREAVVGNKNNPTACVIWLHGLGDSPMGWAGAAQEWAGDLPHTKWRLPCAPEQPVTCNGGMDCTSWMDLIEIPIRVASPDNGQHLAASIAAIHSMIDEEVAGGISADRIVIGGFSQGGALALCAAVKYPHPIGGCCVLSGWAPPKQDLAAQLATSSDKETPFIVCHGDSDNVVLFENAENVNAMLESAGRSVEFQKYRGMAHSSCPQEQLHILDFLTKCLPKEVPEPKRQKGDGELKGLAEAKAQLANCGAYTMSDGNAHPMIGYGTYKVGIIPASATGSGGVASGDPSLAKDCVLAALDVGYRFFDCAQYYGNEDFIGAALKESGVPRSELFLASKVWCDTIYKGPEAIVAQVEKTLEDLQTDYVDLYLVHWPVPSKHIECYKTLEKLQAEGKIKSLGLSNYSIEDHQELVAAGLRVNPVVNQVEANPFLSRVKTFAYFKEQGVLMQSYRSLRNGSQMDNEALNTIGAKYGKTAAQVLGRWCVQSGIVYMPKSTKKHRMVENALVFDFTLSDGDMRELSKLTTSENLETMKSQYLKCCVRDTPLEATKGGLRTEFTLD